MKTLKKYSGQYRIIGYYVYDNRKNKWVFPTKAEGVGMEDWCIPLKLTPRKDDWFLMSNISFVDDDLCVYIPSVIVGRRILTELKKVCNVIRHEVTDEEYIIFIPSDSLDKKEVVKILKPFVKGRSFSPRSGANLPKKS